MSKALSRAVCEDIVLTGSGDLYRVIELGPVASALGSTKLAALPTLDALSIADIIGSFSGKGKLANWKAFRDEDVISEDVISTLGNLKQAAIIQLVKCGSQKNRCSNNRCQFNRSLLESAFVTYLLLLILLSVRDVLSVVLHSEGSNYKQQQQLASSNFKSTMQICLTTL